MPAKARDLFGAIASFPALRAAALRAAAGKRAKPGPAAFLAGLETEVLRLERELATGRYRPGRYTTWERPRSRACRAVRSCKPRLKSGCTARRTAHEERTGQGTARRLGPNI